nr:MAG TPA: hypothetical protein [Caudoviricetes sp.]
MYSKISGGMLEVIVLTGIRHHKLELLDDAQQGRNGGVCRAGRLVIDLNSRIGDFHFGTLWCDFRDGQAIFVHVRLRLRQQIQLGDVAVERRAVQKVCVAVCFFCRILDFPAFLSRTRARENRCDVAQNLMKG